MTASLVVLLASPADADTVAQRLVSRLRALPHGGAVVERPPDALLGTNFITRPAEAQAWWETAAAAGASEWWMVVDDSPLLADEIDGVASNWIVWCRESGRVGEYAALPNACGLVAGDAREFADALLEWLGRDERLAGLLRPTFGPFRRLAPEEWDGEPPAADGASAGREADLIGTALTDPGPGGHGRPPGATALIIGPPPIEPRAAAARARAMGDEPPPALRASWDHASPTERPADVGSSGRVSDRRAEGPADARLKRAPHAAVPPPPSVGTLAPAAVLAPPALLPTAIPPPPPVAEPAADSSPAAEGTGGRAVIPPSPDEAPLVGWRRGGSGGARTAPDEAISDDGSTMPFGAVPSDWASVRSGASRTDETAEAGAGASTAGDPAAVDELVGSGAAPLDVLPVLEPPAGVVEAVEPGPRQVGLWSLPVSWGRKRRRGAPRELSEHNSASTRPSASAARAIDDRPLDEMTEPQLRGEAARLLMLGPPLVIVCCSRKGGVGKTYDVLGIAELADEAGEAFAVRSVLLEQNLENPDLRVVLGLPDATATVRQLDRALSDGMEAPGAAHPTQSALSVYVEERETSAYPRQSIERIAQHCRSRYGLTAVDLANCLPDVTGGKAAQAVAHWLRHADVVMMPTDASRSGLKGLAEMIDAVRVQGAVSAQGLPGIVIPFLVQPGGKALQYPGIQEILDRYDGQGAQPVAVPFSEETQLAGWEDANGQRTTILDDDVVRLAYWRLLVAVLRAGNGREVA